jgi:uncharacterized protein (DUF1684 family)
MSRYLVSILFFFACFPVVAQVSYTDSIQQIREKLNTEFADPATSILKKEDLTDFEGLSFYSPDENFRIKAKFRKARNAKAFEMKTSTDRLPMYKAYGKLVFKIDRVKYHLTIYQMLDAPAAYADYLFCPFTDLTNDDETYGGGRYLDFRKDDLDEPLIDFNLCYNPYFAYNDRYSCPIPPKENFLNVRIEAGVKRYKDH